MNLKIFGLVILVGALTAVHFFRSVNSGASVVSLELVEKYRQWCTKHSKLYSTPAENQYRLSVFGSQLDYIRQSNEDYVSYHAANNLPLPEAPAFEVNGFADLTESEFGVMYTGGKIDPDMQVDEAESNLPAKKHNLEQGYPLKIRQQGSCGSCWAFTAVTFMEKHFFDKFRQIVDLSFQELVDCETGSNGCGGGYCQNCASYVARVGIARESDYPYKGVKGSCQAASKKKVSFGNTIASKMPGFSFANVSNLINAGVRPGVSMRGGGKVRYAARDGQPYNAIAAGECGMGMDHFANLIAYTQTTVTLQNSWGTGWGDNGVKVFIPCSGVAFNCANNWLYHSMA